MAATNLGRSILANIILPCSHTSAALGIAKAMRIAYAMNRILVGSPGIIDPRLEQLLDATYDELSRCLLKAAAEDSKVMMVARAQHLKPAVVVQCETGVRQYARD